MYGSCSDGPLSENHTLYAGKILIWRNFVHLRPFLSKIDIFNSFLPITSKRRYESSQFLVWKLFLWSFLRKSYSICLENSDLAKFWSFKKKIWPFLGQNWQFSEFLTYNFQTPLWIFPIFGMEVVRMVFFEEIILYMPGKFWFGEILVIQDENLAIFSPKLTVLRVFGL